MSRFLDTNVLLYSISAFSGEREKRDIARELLESDDNVLSVQVPQECHVQSTRTTRSDVIAHDTAVGLIEAWLRFPVQSINTDVFRLALDLRARLAWSYWDAAIIAATTIAGCSALLTEDLQDGQRVGGLTLPSAKAGGFLLHRALPRIAGSNMHSASVYRLRMPCGDVSRRCAAWFSPHTWMLGFRIRLFPHLHA